MGWLQFAKEYEDYIIAMRREFHIWPELSGKEEETVRRILEEEMERAADLKVRLETDVHNGTDWFMAK
ncbi:MAG: hypothetical protein IJC61_04845 [Oscillospiraceae bacterium]|nr:hypothetical protein [Oscillospiraceae bacterium]